MADTKLQAAIRAFLASSGMSERGLSVRARMNEKGVSQILSGKSQHPRIDTIESLAMAMGMGVSELLEHDMTLSSPTGVAMVQIKHGGEPPALPTRIQAPMDVPVLGTAMGANGDGAFILNLTGGDVVDRAPRYPGLKDNLRAFAIYVEGDSMWPRFDPGDLIYIDPNRPARVGDDVVIVVESPEKGEAPRAYLKHLVRRSPSKIVAKQFNPLKEVEFEGSRVKDLFRVLRPKEWMGG